MEWLIRNWNASACRGVLGRTRDRFAQQPSQAIGWIGLIALIVNALLLLLLGRSIGIRAVLHRVLAAFACLWLLKSDVGPDRLLGSSLTVNWWNRGRRRVRDLR